MVMPESLEPAERHSVAEPPVLSLSGLGQPEPAQVVERERFERPPVSGGAVVLPFRGSVSMFDDDDDDLDEDSDEDFGEASITPLADHMPLGERTGPVSPAAPSENGAATGASLGLVGGAPTGRRVRARLARFNAPWQTPQVSGALEPLISQHRNSHPKADIRLLQRAYDTAEHWHSGQYRKSGDPYITHPLAVANILADLGMDTTTLVAALLHDTIEDTGSSWATLPRRRRSARWSSRWPRTHGSW